MRSAEDLVERTTELLTLCHQLMELVSDGWVSTALNTKSEMPELEVQANPTNLTGNQHSRLVEQVDKFNFHAQTLLRHLPPAHMEIRPLIFRDLVASGEEIVELFYGKVVDQQSLDRFQQKVNSFYQRIQQKASELSLLNSGTDSGESSARLPSPNSSTQVTTTLAQKERLKRALLSVVEAKEVAKTSITQKKQKPLSDRNELLMQAVKSKRKGPQWPTALDNLGVQPPQAWECRTYAEAYRNPDLRKKLQQEKANFIRRHCKK